MGKNRTKLEEYMNFLMTNGTEIFNCKSKAYDTSHVSICQMINGTTTRPVPETKLAIVSGLQAIWAKRVKSKAVPSDTLEPGAWLFDDEGEAQE